MPNNSRDDMDSCTVKVIGLLGGIAAFVIKAGISIAMDCATNSDNQKIISKIAALEAKKRRLGGEFLGPLRHKSEIDEIDDEIDDLTEHIKTK